MELLNSVNSQYSLRKSTVKINVENPKIYDLECIGFQDKETGFKCGEVIAQVDQNFKDIEEMHQKCDFVYSLLCQKTVPAQVKKNVAVVVLQDPFE